MNFLAHAFLSGDNEELILGNILADFIKGSYIGMYSAGIQKGIILHREIDYYTDHHPVVERSKERLRPIFSHYSPVVGDIFYDHFLACRFSEHSSMPLNDYVRKIYRIMDRHNAILPDRLKRFMEFVRFLNIFESYSRVEGIEMVLNKMAQRAHYVSHLEKGGEELRRNYHHYEADFNEFFPDLEAFVKIRL